MCGPEYFNIAKQELINLSKNIQSDSPSIFDSARSYLSQMFSGIGIEMPDEILETLKTRSVSDAISCSRLVSRSQAVEHATKTVANASQQVLQQFNQFVEGCIGLINHLKSISIDIEIPEEYAKRIVHIIIFVSASLADMICKDAVGDPLKGMLKTFIQGSCRIVLLLCKMPISG